MNVYLITIEMGFANAVGSAITEKETFCIIADDLTNMVSIIVDNIGERSWKPLWHAVVYVYCEPVKP